MLNFKMTTYHGGDTIVVESDDFAELHRTVARIQELQKDAQFLTNKGAQGINLEFHTNAEGHEFYGFRDTGAYQTVTFGQNKEKVGVPFFPKGEDGYFKPDSQYRQEGPPAEGVPYRTSAQEI